MSMYKGFYFSIGESNLGLPANYDPRDKIGSSFDTNGEITETFEANLRNIESVFHDLAILKKTGKSSLDGTLACLNADSMGVLYLENKDTGNDAGAPKAEEMNVGGDTVALLNILEYIYKNQEAVLAAAPANSNYNNAGHYTLLAINDAYLGGIFVSLEILESRFGTRIQSFILTCNINNIELSFEIYYDPDLFMQVKTADPTLFKVYTYEDQQPYGDEGYNTISDVEFKNNIIDKIFEIMKNEDWNSYRIFETERYFFDTGGVELNPDNPLNQIFVVFSKSLVYSHTNEYTAMLVKQYLRDKSPAEEIIYFQQRWPKLFLREHVVINPFYDHLLDINNNTVQKHSLTYQEIINKVQEIAYDEVSESFEIFYLGSITDSIDEGVNIPMSIIHTNTANKKNFYNKFPEYQPLTIETYPGEGSNNVKTKRFQFVLLNIMRFILGFDEHNRNIKSFFDAIAGQDWGVELNMRWRYDDNAFAILDEISRFYICFTFEGSEYRVQVNDSPVDNYGIDPAIPDPAGWGLDDV